MNYTFNNSSIVSVNSGTIVLNVSGKTRTFADAKLVSAVDGKIVLDLPECFVTNGKYMVLNNILIFIAETLLPEEDAITYHVSQVFRAAALDYDDCWCLNHQYRKATSEEIRELDDQLAAEGRRWNPSTMQIEKLRWKPVNGQTYYYVGLEVRPYISFHIWRNDAVDDSHYQAKNCFRTEEEAKVLMEKIEKVLLEN